MHQKIAAPYPEIVGDATADHGQYLLPFGCRDRPVVPAIRGSVPQGLIAEAPEIRSDGCHRPLALCRLCRVAALLDQHFPRIFLDLGATLLIGTSL